ncbi:hypothetical protein chiPu_0033337, partial [Chiloscyllium punctatum]|nr:hypothetical protein [Chiloscyllium punctatum]
LRINKAGAEIEQRACTPPRDRPRQRKTPSKTLKSWIGEYRIAPAQHAIMQGQPRDAAHCLDGIRTAWRVGCPIPGLTMRDRGHGGYAANWASLAGTRRWASESMSERNSAPLGQGGIASIAPRTRSCKR